MNEILRRKYAGKWGVVVVLFFVFAFNVCFGLKIADPVGFVRIVTKGAENIVSEAIRAEFSGSQAQIEKLSVNFYPSEGENKINPSYDLKFFDPEIRLKFALSYGRVVEIIAGSSGNEQIEPNSSIADDIDDAISAFVKGEEDFYDGSLLQSKMAISLRSAATTWLVGPFQECEIPEKPKVVTSNDFLDSVQDSLIVLSDKPLIGVVGRAGDVVQVAVVNAKNPGEKVFFGQKVVIDEQNGAVVLGKEGLKNGDYYAVAIGENGVGEVSQFKVDYWKVLKAPLVTVDGENLSIKAKKGTKIMIVFRELISSSSSVVFATASQGKFDVKIPNELPSGVYEAMTMMYDPKENVASDVATVVFGK